MTGPETSIEPVVGWRIWHVDPRAEGVSLRSYAQGTDWPAGRRMEAGCRRRFGLGWRRDHEAPRAGHRCGIYAFRRREDAEELVTRLRRSFGPIALRTPIAVGRVSLWGRVIENTGGWRAQYGYPYDLVLHGGDAALAAELRGRYAVDVTLAS